MLALLICRVKRFSHIYKTLLIWPYAVTPVIAAVLFRFMFNPAIGIGTEILGYFGYEWNYHLNQWDAFFIVVLSAVWQQVSYNFLFFLVGLRSIPSSFRRFIHITLPLLSPTTFFLFVMNLLYAFFDTFGIIHIITQGGPSNSTNILVYKVFNDGFVGLDIGISSAQSVILMLIVSACVLFQFKYVEKKVHYS